MSKKKIILIIVACIVAFLSIIGLVWWIGFGTPKEKVALDGNTSKVSKLYDELEKKESYSFLVKLDENNQDYYAKSGDQAYISTISDGEDYKMIVKDGNSYLLLDEEKTYYTYQNNETNLEKVLLQLESAKESKYTEGKEKIQGKEYQYEEYEGVTEFLLNGDELSTKEEENAKTRFYFTKDQLSYIKTIVGEDEELLQVQITDQIDEKLFEIPAEYSSEM